ncbi:VWDE [Branchiostoma lanceolatum]|uniref:VWDE protein n=1 Tax=Branchiostoma lanceolatum TaxID=7740 RepID=A0A8J9VG45_BRALA|nr:VWDE [Branchiostoma lanceolatum]
MPSATTVVAEVNHWGIDVHAYAPAADVGHTLGLCGTWDDPPNTGNDFTLPDGSLTTDAITFGNSWR